MNIYAQIINVIFEIKNEKLKSASLSNTKKNQEYVLKNTWI